MNAPIIYRLKLSTKIAFGLLLVTVMVNGCASTSDTGTGAGQQASADKQAPKLPADFAMPSAGKSKIVFIRTNKNNGAFDLAVHDGELMIGRSSRSTYFIYECEPGQHVFSSSFGNVGILNADLLAERIYYVDVALVAQTWGPAWVKMDALYPGCAEINWTEMPKILADLEKSTITSKQVEHDKTGIKRYMERLKKYQDEATPGYFNKILPEYGQTTPLSSQ